MRYNSNPPVQPRRKFVTGIATGLAAFVAAPELLAQAAAPAQKPGANPLRTALHHKIDFKVPAGRIYDALLDPVQFAKLTGAPAEIDAKAGGTFSLFGARIVGRNIELVPGQRIVQAWRPAHWDAGVYSIVRFELKSLAAGTSLLLDHIGFPEGDADSLEQGWREHYIETLEKYFA
jgi:activator of HSP90 ATPase